MAKPTPKERGRIEGTAHFKLKTRAPLTARYSQALWTYLYVILGFALSIEATVISLIEPLKWWERIGVMVLVWIATAYLVLYNGRVRNRLISWKVSYEEKER